METNKGFTLLEILLVMFLMTIVFTFVFQGDGDSRTRLESVVNMGERAFAFAHDEVAITNSIHRVRFVFPEEEGDHTITVEKGPVGSFTLPSFVTEIKEQRFESDEEKQDNQIKDLDRDFSRVEEFKEEDFVLEEGMKIVAVASLLSKQLITSGDFSVYFYPTGEQDAAIVFFANEEEMISLELDAFNTNFRRDYFKLLPPEGKNLDEYRLSVAKEKFDEWVK